jgi:ABC-type lipoprotein export system ATPase subunit
VIICGKDTSKLNDKEKTSLRREYFGFIFQTFNLIPTLSVLENIQLPLLPQKLSKEENKEIEVLLERVGLYKRRRHLPQELSQGEQQRVSIVRALVNNPKAILADELTSSLDPENTKIILDLLTGISKEKKILLVVAGNDILNLEKQFNKKVHLEEGLVKPD